MNKSKKKEKKKKQRNHEIALETKHEVNYMSKKH